MYLYIYIVRQGIILCLTSYGEITEQQSNKCVKDESSDSIAVVIVSKKTTRQELKSAIVSYDIYHIKISSFSL